MRTKRLLVILIIFILIGGTGIAVGQIFIVRNIDPTFVNHLAYIDNEAIIQNNIRENLEFVRGRSILFSVDRTRIRETVEDVDYRIRVTNIEAVFPNTIRISLRERYPVFSFTHPNGQRMILDSQLRFVTDELDNESNLICIIGQVDVPITVAPVTGMFLTDFFKGDYYDSEQMMRIARLRELAELFFGQIYLYEDSLTHLFNNFAFDTPEPNDMLLTFTIPGKTVRIRDITNPSRFFEMIDLVWDTLVVVNQRPGNFVVEYIQGIGARVIETPIGG